MRTRATEPASHKRRASGQLHSSAGNRGLQVATEETTRPKGVDPLER